MDIEVFATQVEQDLESLVEEHEGAASNEHIWALGSSGEEATMHEANAELHRELAEFYRRMSTDMISLIKHYGG